MAEALYLVTKTVDPGDSTVNGITAVLINKDDAQTDAQIKADAVAQVNVLLKGGQTINDPVPADYFDTVDKVSDLVAGSLKDNKDAYVFLPGSVAKVEGA